ncbi:hypothetical protein PUNSTDRAFT_143326 [Punctularia strigosozonata HHB-11173 SS5]|uniref:uncharacterized protein n=1 Tax=Punctularia strigosozonata (strain HHB-11173) TaxID=741275 RepID=UPI0004416A49|nr:uncharacterized protein PUNSTDRAFT_143326 [Punctularia strigosozonata HHB-11173 SS5]EIN09939.1 hypothetical protein PUNSTDRAFT_143326 [Punctularia strigosozonata HHB-11173 SS5]
MNNPYSQDEHDDGATSSLGIDFCDLDILQQFVSLGFSSESESGHHLQCTNTDTLYGTIEDGSATSCEHPAAFVHQADLASYQSSSGLVDSQPPAGSDLSSWDTASADLPRLALSPASCTNTSYEHQPSMTLQIRDGVGRPLLTPLVTYAPNGSSGPVHGESDQSGGSSPNLLSSSLASSPTLDPLSAHMQAMSPYGCDGTQAYFHYAPVQGDLSPGMLSPHSGFRSRSGSFSSVSSGRGASRSRSPSSRASPYPVRTPSPSPSMSSVYEDNQYNSVAISDTEDGGLEGSLPPNARRHSLGQITKPVVTTAKVAAAAAGRRKSDASFQCPICGARLTSKKNYEGHVNAHLGEKPYVCGAEGCSETFAREWDCKRHKRTTHCDARFECVKCRRLFKRNDSRMKHGKHILLLEVAPSLSESSQSANAPRTTSNAVAQVVLTVQLYNKPSAYLTTRLAM